MIEFHQVFRLRSGAVECDENSPRVAGIPLLIGAHAKGWAVRPRREIERDLTETYGVPIDVTEKMARIGVVAESLGPGELARAQIATLLLKFPDPGKVDPESPLGLRKLAVLIDAGWIAKDWGPSKQPRVGSGPNPGWFAPTDGGAEDPSSADSAGPEAKQPAGVQVAELEPVSAAPAPTSGAGDGAIVVPVGGEEEARFPWEERNC